MRKLLIWILCVIVAVLISNKFIDDAAIGFLNGVVWGFVAIFLCEVTE